MPDVPHELVEIRRAARDQAAARAAHLDALRDDLTRTGGRSLPSADAIEGLGLLARAAEALRAVADAAAGDSEPKDDDHG